MGAIVYEDFARVEMRVGRIVRVEDFPAARQPAYKLWIDFGPYGVRPSSAQITRLYRKEDLPGRLVVAVTNLPPKRIAGFVSEVLVLGVDGPEGGVVLLRPDAEVALGSRVY